MPYKHILVVMIRANAAPILWEFHRGALQVGKGRLRFWRFRVRDDVT